MISDSDLKYKTALIEECQPAYALTTHKSQGSEFKHVIIYVGKDADLLHVDQWFYTAFTRAKQKVYIYGYDTELISTVMREMPYRRTFMKHRIQTMFSRELNDLLKTELQNTPK